MLDTVTAVPLPSPPPVIVPVETVRRVNAGDLIEMGPWLGKRIAEKSPEFHPLSIPSYLRGFVDSNDSFFCRYKSAIMLAVVVTAPLRKPWVEEVFALAQDDPEELVELYHAVGRWTAGKGMGRIVILRHGDLAKDVIQLKVGRTRNETWATMLVQAGS